MNSLYEGIEFDTAQTAMMCRGLLDLAAVDGVHDTEIALIKDFYSGSGGGAQDLEVFANAGFDLEEAAAILKGDQAVAFLLSCYMLIYADGLQSDEERVRIGEYAAALDISEGRLEELHVQARLYLLSVMAETLKNRAVVQAMGMELGLSADVIASAMKEEN
jgi:hypothetical protein